VLLPACDGVSRVTVVPRVSARSTCCSAGVGALNLVGCKEMPLIAKATGSHTRRGMTLFPHARATCDTFSGEALAAGVSED
jgi:hypothetical protein